MDDKKLYTPKELASKWGCSAKLIRKLVEVEILASIRLGKKLIMVKADSVEEYENAQEILQGVEPRRPIPVRPKLSTKKTYVFKCGDFVKIGRSDDVPSRHNAIISSNPHGVELVREFNSDLEFMLHNHFAQYRHRREWFRVEGELKSWIAGGCEPFWEQHHRTIIPKASSLNMSSTATPNAPCRG